jgi:hypothetical protein
VPADRPYPTDLLILPLFDKRVAFEDREAVVTAPADVGVHKLQPLLRENLLTSVLNLLCELFHLSEVVLGLYPASQFEEVLAEVAVREK